MTSFDVGICYDLITVIRSLLDTFLVSSVSFLMFFLWFDLSCCLAFKIDLPLFSLYSFFELLMYFLCVRHFSFFLDLIVFWFWGLL